MIWLATYYIWFVFYSVVGWIWEVIICSLPAKKFINRGFLNGPYCPIYGSGALLIITLLSSLENPVWIFLVGSLLTCTLEYITSWAMEKLFHTRWWDYSTHFLNINGRVCLMGAVAFGAFSVIIIKLIHPAVVLFTAQLPELALSITALVLFALMLTDTVYTITRFSEFETKLKELNEWVNNALSTANEQRKAMMEKLQNSEIYTKLTAPYSEIYKRVNSQERRMIKAFPKLRSTRYNEALQKIKQYILRKGDDEDLP